MANPDIPVIRRAEKFKPFEYARFEEDRHTTWKIATARFDLQIYKYLALPFLAHTWLPGRNERSESLSIDFECHGQWLHTQGLAKRVQVDPSYYRMLRGLWPFVKRLEVRLWADDSKYWIVNRVNKGDDGGFVIPMEIHYPSSIRDITASLHLRKKRGGR